MGSASSKAAKTAAGAASRQYPTRVPPNPLPSNSSAPRQPSTYTSPIASTPSQAAQASQPPTANGASVDAPPTSTPQSVSTSRNAAIDRDASDPQFAASLRQLGPVTPSSTMSNSSTFSSPPPSSASSSTTTTAPPSTTHQHPSSGTIFPDQSRNPALMILQARERIAAEAEREFTAARTGNVVEGRRFLDVGLIREALVLRDAKGMKGEEIEAKLGLRKGVMGLLARVGEARVGKVDAGDSGIY